MRVRMNAYAVMRKEKNELKNLLAVVLIAYAFAETKSKWVAAATFHFNDQINLGSKMVDESPLMPVDDDVLMVPITLIQGADAKGAVCLDGTLPAYHWDRGFGPGTNNWVVDLEGGGWCNNLRSCAFRKKTRHGSSNYMEKQIPFTGILSNNINYNPDFYNWNRVKVRYCDGASFAGEGVNKTRDLQFRGQRIFETAMQELMSKGMRSAVNVLLAGCSAGGHATILHCDQFSTLFPAGTNVKCLADAGLFMDAVDVSGGHAIRNFYSGVVNMQDVQQNLPKTCTSRFDPISCFFPQNLIEDIKTPLLILNAAYDSWQVEESLAPPSVDPRGEWTKCRVNHQICSASQISFLQDFRNSMLNAVKNFSQSTQNGLFMNSCFAHCQSERQDAWFAPDSPVIGNKAIASAVGDWYFDRARVVDIDCPYPCDSSSCHNIS